MYLCIIHLIYTHLLIHINNACTICIEIDINLHFHQQYLSVFFFFLFFFFKSSLANKTHPWVVTFGAKHQSHDQENLQLFYSLFRMSLWHPVHRWGEMKAFTPVRAASNERASDHLILGSSPSYFQLSSSAAADSVHRLFSGLSHSEKRKFFQVRLIPALPSI